MTRTFKLIAALLVGMIIICGYSFLTDKTHYTKWSIENIRPGNSEISWAPFVWSNDTISEKYFEKSAMHIPCKIEGLPFTFTFQFDLGANVSGLYENNVSSFYKKYPDLENRFDRLRSPLQFWTNKRAFKDLHISFANYKLSNKWSYFYNDYGEKFYIDSSTPKDTFPIGTIGADLFENKTLIIDYPNQRFAICDTIPNLYNMVFSNIELDEVGRVLLPMSIKGKNYKILFDNGSSLFPLIVTDDKINSFSTLSNTDTLKVNSWGVYHNIIGRFMTDSFQLAGLSFVNTKVYADFRSEQRTNQHDGTTGNFLFWDKTIIIDFRNKKFGVK